MVECLELKRYFQGSKQKEHPSIASLEWEDWDWHNVDEAMCFDVRVNIYAGVDVANQLDPAAVVRDAEGMILHPWRTADIAEHYYLHGSPKPQHPFIIFVFEIVFISRALSIILVEVREVLISDLMGLKVAVSVREGDNEKSHQG
jgi:hypothetical protein